MSSRDSIYDAIARDMLCEDGYIDGVAQSNRIQSLSQEQRDALDAIEAFMQSESKQFVLGGVAGSGKSTIIPYIQRLYSHVQVCAYTGKAVTVLLRKGIRDACTLHSFLYHSRIEQLPNGEKKMSFYEKEDWWFNNVSLVVVDEASMVSVDIYKCLSRKQFKVVYIGDHFQLPPVGDYFNIMSQPDFKMETVLRQNAGNPIVMLATMARLGEKLPYGKFGDSYHTKNLVQQDLLGFDQVITWTNKCKDALNEIIRRRMGLFNDRPEDGDKMIVKANQKSLNLYNGQIVYLRGSPKKCRGNKLWEVKLIDELAHDDAFIMASTDALTHCKASIHLTQDELNKLRVSPTHSNYSVPLDWGYAITCHAAQGSSWKSVAIVDEKRHHYVDEYNRWIYTAITRAEEKVAIYTIDGLGI